MKNKQGKEVKMKHENLAKNLEPKKLSYAELQKFDDDRRYELIDGIPYLMSSPKVSHQEVIGQIYFQIASQLKEKGKKCKVFFSPLDVKLSGEPDDTKEFFVVQPDIMVVCDQKKITEKNILGAPDLVIEVLSPSNPGHDKIVKLNLYRDFGVREYWIISLEEKIIYVFNFDNKKEQTQCYYLNDKIKINILEDIYIDLKEFCEDNNIKIKKQ